MVARTPRDRKRAEKLAEAAGADAAHGEQILCAKRVTKKCDRWLSIRSFTSVGECVAALRAGGWAIWATDLSPEAVLFDERAKAALTPLPARLAVVVGRESDGISAEMRAAADRLLYLEMHGFTESFNLSVATALMLQKLFDWCPDARGDLADDERSALRDAWTARIAPNPTAEAKHRAWLGQERSTAGGDAGGDAGGGRAIPPLDDLRRETPADRDRWIPRKIQRQEERARAAASSAGPPGESREGAPVDRALGTAT